MKSLLLAILCAFLLSSCGKRDAIVDAVQPIKEPKTIEELEASLAHHKGQLAKIEMELSSAYEAQDRAREGRLKAIGWTVGAFSILGAIACVGLGIWLGRRGFFVGAAACAGMAVVAIGFAVLVPYLPILGVSLALVLVGYAIWSIRKMKASQVSLARFGARLASGEDVATVKKEMRKEQIAAGIHDEVHAIAQKVKQ